MFVVTEIQENTLGRAWVFATLEESIDRAMISIQELNMEVDYYTSTLNGVLTKAGTFTRKNMEQNLGHYNNDRSVCIGQLEN